MSSSDIIIAYNKNDFFYVNAENNGEMPVKSDCNSLDIMNVNWDISCNPTHFDDNSGNCLKRALCVNKELAGTLNELQRQHSGSDERYANATDIYDETFAHTLNLGTGIVLLSVLLYKIVTTNNNI